MLVYAIALNCSNLCYRYIIRNSPNLCCVDCCWCWRCSAFVGGIVSHPRAPIRLLVNKVMCDGLPGLHCKGWLVGAGYTGVAWRAYTLPVSVGQLPLDFAFLLRARKARFVAANTACLPFHTFLNAFRAPPARVGALYTSVLYDANFDLSSLITRLAASV